MREIVKLIWTKQYDGDLTSKPLEYRVVEFDNEDGEGKFYNLYDYQSRKVGSYKCEAIATKEAQKDFEKDIKKCLVETT